MPDGPTYTCATHGGVKDGEFFEFAFAVVGDSLTVYVNRKRILNVAATWPCGAPCAAGVNADQGRCTE